MKPEPQIPKSNLEADKNLAELKAVLKKLRSPAGCPWDREQTARSLIPYLLEETYEVIESIENNDQQAMQEELGDLLLHILFQAEIAEEQGWFALDDCITSITQKLVDRHPHVFKGDGAQSAQHAKKNWEAVKQKAKRRSSRLDGVPQQLPALTRARRIQEKAAYVGFDWNNIEPVWEKVQEELDELRQAQTDADQDALEEELGDLLFSLVNLGRFLGLSAEEALRRTIGKFEYRFRNIEQELKSRGKTPEEATLEEMDEIWNRYRNMESSGK